MIAGIKKMIKKAPILGPMLTAIYSKWISPHRPFPGSEKYWVDLYAAGGNSGDGSFGKLAEFKAEVLNGFVREKGIRSVIEYGCGDGNQLGLAKYPSYLGFDVSLKAIEMCRKLFNNDPSKTFKLMKEYSGEKAQLTLSLDVVYHLIEDEVFEDYMRRLFASAEDYVIIYSSNRERSEEDSAHERSRKFTDWVEVNQPGWRLFRHIPNKYPYTGDNRTGSLADFFIYERA